MRELSPRSKKLAKKNQLDLRCTSYLAGRFRLSIERLASRDWVLASLSGSGASLVEMDTRAWERRNVKWR